MLFWYHSQLLTIEMEIIAYRSVENESLLKVMHGINMTLNKTNCDWFLYMSVMWPIGQSLAKKKGHGVQTF